MLGRLGARRLFYALPTQSRPAIPIRPGHWHNRQSIRTVMSTIPVPLDFSAGPLVWIDCEMTGLDHKKDKIMEIAVLITNGNLDLVDEGVEYIIHVDKEHLDGMDEWCTNQHGRSGLTKACLESSNKLENVSKEVVEYIKKRIPNERTGVLAGNSVHVDKLFLYEQMPEVVNWLHYRIVDVSTIKELSRRWYSQQGAFPRISENSHRALDDIKASIKELQWYREHIFVPPGAVRHPSPSRTASPTNGRPRSRSRSSSS